MDEWEHTVPLRIQTIMQKYSEICNSPRIGCASNYAFPGLQINLTAEQHGDNSECPSTQRSH